MNNILSRMGRIYRVLSEIHHMRVVPLFLGAAFGVLRAIVAVCMALDHVFFPRLAKAKVSRPIVLVGNPRTGTTFLQRFLADNGFGAGMQLVFSLYPSLLLQKLIKPILPVLEKVSPAKFHSDKVHDTKLSSVETDDVALLFRYLDGFFLWGFFLSFLEEDLMPQVDPQVRDTSDRDADWMEALWRRSLVHYKAERNVAKLFSTGPRLPQFLKRFPDAQILYMARDPLSVIPSTMSLVIGPLDKAFGFWNKPEAIRKRWLERMYQGQIMLLKRFHEHWTTGQIDKSRVYVVRYDRMMNEFETVMDEICVFLGQEITPKLRETIDKRAAKQRSYKSEHAYNLEKYGLTEEQVRRDCSFFYDTFLPPLEPKVEEPVVKPFEQAVSQAS